MKIAKFAGLALLLLLLSAGSAFAQYNVLKVDALGYIRNRLYLGYERTFLKQASVGVAYENYAYASEGVAGGGDYELRSKGVLPEFRYYPFHKRKTAPLGFFAGAAFRYATVRETYTPTKVELKGDVFNWGLITGYKVRYKMFVGEALLGYGGGSLSKEFADASRSDFKSLSDEKYRDDMKQNLRMELSVGVVFPKIRTKTSGKY